MIGYINCLFSRRSRKDRCGTQNGRSDFLATAVEPLEARRLLTTITSVTSSTSYQAEATNLVFTPVGSSVPTVVAAYNDYGLPLHHKTGWSLSTNGGSTFTQQTDSSTSLQATDNHDHNYGTDGDPVLARDNTSGAIYLVTMSEARTQIDSFKAPYNAGSTSFQAPIRVAGDPSVSTNPAVGNDLVDKPWITVDNWPGAGQGTVYVAFNFTRSGNSPLESTWTDGIYLFASTDGGSVFNCIGVNAFGAPVSGNNPLISSATTSYNTDPNDPSNGENHSVSHKPLGIQVVVGKDHQPFVVWWDRDVDTNLGTSSSVTTEQIMWSHELNVSPNVGHWSTPAIVASETVKSNQDLAALILNGDSGSSRGPNDANSLPQATVNPANGDVYVTWADGPGSADPNAGDRGDVLFKQLHYSSTLGYDSSTWAGGTSIDGNNANDQWDPAVAVSSNGAFVFVGYYSRQDDSSNQLIKPYATIGSVASDGTITWATPQSLSGLSNFRQPSNNFGKMGDYNTASADYSNFYYSFCQSNSNGNGSDPQIKMAIVPIPYVSPPAAPGNLAAAAGTLGGSPVINVSWTGTFASGVEADLQYSTSTGAQWIEYGTTAASDLLMHLTGLDPSTNYYFRLRTHDANDTTSSSFVYATYYAFAAPTSFQCAWGATTSDPISLTWAGSWASGVVADVQFKSPDVLTWTDFGTVSASADAMSFSPTLFSANKSYDFQIRAQNSTAVGFSPYASAAAPGESSVSVLQYNDAASTIDVYWGNPPHDSQTIMHLEYSTDSGSTWTDSAANTAWASSGRGTVHSLTPSATTLIRIYAVSQNGCASFISDPVDTAPAILTGTNDGNGEYEFTWDSTPYLYGNPRYVMHLQYNDGFGWADPQYYTTYADGGWGAISGLSASHGYSFRIAIVPTSGDAMWSAPFAIGGV